MVADVNDPSTSLRMYATMFNRLCSVTSDHVVSVVQKYL